IQKGKLKERYESERNKKRALEDELSSRKHNEQVQRGIITSLEEELKMALEDKQTAELSLEKLEASISLKETNAIEDAPSTPGAVKKYAKYADTGNGFSESYFVDKPNNETIFEITMVSPDIATYVVSSDLNVQKYALSNADYFLRRACQYDSLPTMNSVISTTTPGQLRKEGNKWIIDAPAKVSF
ncbi:MAG TPA: hypothetical protein VEB42_05285, partial [Chitinophagaceae bacterium]|nr:hypothetical protein [Chitinophagaceae bacterium]